MINDFQIQSEFYRFQGHISVQNPYVAHLSMQLKIRFTEYYSAKCFWQHLRIRNVDSCQH